VKISFDIDGVLDTEAGLELAKRLIKSNNRVYIITARQERFSDEVYAIAKELGIPKLMVYFTGGEDKWKTIKRLGIERHYDDNQEQIQKINDNTEALGIIFKS
jgi:uncharacterized HAD superfamily protein